MWRIGPLAIGGDFAGLNAALRAVVHRVVLGMPMADAVSEYHSVDLDGPVVAAARGLGISFGDR